MFAKFLVKNVLNMLLPTSGIGSSRALGNMWFNLLPCWHCFEHLKTQMFGVTDPKWSILINSNSGWYHDWNIGPRAFCISTTFYMTIEKMNRFLLENERKNSETIFSIPSIEMFPVWSLKKHSLIYFNQNIVTVIKCVQFYILKYQISEKIKINMPKLI